MGYPIRIKKIEISNCRDGLCKIKGRDTIKVPGLDRRCPGGEPETITSGRARDDMRAQTCHCGG